MKLKSFILIIFLLFRGILVAQNTDVTNKNSEDNKYTYYLISFKNLYKQYTEHTLIKGAKYELIDFNTIYDQTDYNGDRTPK